MRQKVKEMVEFVQDDDRLREERKKAKKNKDKYIGVSSDSRGGAGGAVCGGPAGGSLGGNFKNCECSTRCLTLGCDGHLELDEDMVLLMQN